MDRKRIVRGLGKTLISVGVLLFLFVAYQLWGTALVERRGQEALAKEFSEQVLTAPPSLPTPSGGAVQVAQKVELPDLGAAVGIIEIPRIGITKHVVEGVGIEDLKKGPGRYPGTSLPGTSGNAAIAGHRTTYGAPFFDLDQLQPGDPIYVTTTLGRFRYDVRETIIVTPSDAWVLDQTEDNRLTLTTCHPKFSAAQRMIVIADLTTDPIDVDVTGEQPPPTDIPGEDLEVAAGTDVTAGLSGDPSARGPVALWGTVTGAIWLGAWLFARRYDRSPKRRWLVYGATLPIFLASLFVFYENVARLLPSSV